MSKKHGDCEKFQLENQKITKRLSCFSITVYSDFKKKFCYLIIRCYLSTYNERFYNLVSMKTAPNESAREVTACGSKLKEWCKRKKKIC